MWSSRHDQPEPEPELPDVTVAPDPQPEPAKGIRPISMFGTKEEKLARFGPPLDQRTTPPRLVSLGRQIKRVEDRTGRQGGTRMYEYEGYVNMLRPHEKWVRWPGEKEPSLQADVTYASDPPPVPLGVFRKDGRMAPPTHCPVTGEKLNIPEHPPGRPNQVVPFPEVSEQELALARALFAKPVGGPSDPPPEPLGDPCPW